LKRLKRLQRRPKGQRIGRGRKSKLKNELYNVKLRPRPGQKLRLKS